MSQNAEIKIETNVPMERTHAHRKYPFGDMKVGDCFLAPQGTQRDLLASAASYYGSRNNMKFATRITPEGYRVWRTA